MLEKIVNAVKTYGEVYRDAVVKRDHDEAEVRSTYIGTRLASELGRIAEEFNTTWMNAKEQAKSIVAEEFSSLTSKAEAVVTSPIDPDFMMTLEVIKTLENPSKTELETIVKKHKNNYFCYRSICDALGGKAKGYHVVTLDEVKEEIENAKNKTRKALDADVNEYYFLTFEKGLVLEPYDEFFTDFIEGRFDEATALLEE